MELLFNKTSNESIIKCNDNMDTIYLSNGIYGFFGPTNSGIEKLLKDLSTLSPNTTNINFFISDKLNKNHDLINDISYIPKDFGIYGNYTPKDYLSYIALLKGHKKQDIQDLVSYLLKVVRIGEYENTLISKIGKRKTIVMRIILASAFTCSPKIVLLDRLFTNIPLEEFEYFRNIIRLLSKNKIVIISSHYMETLSPLCDKILMLKDNKVIAYDTMQNNLAKLSNKIFTITTNKEEEITEINKKYTIISSSKTKNHILFRVISESVPLYNYVIPEKPTLKDLYLYLYNENYNPKN